MIGEDGCLHFLLLHIKDTELMVCAASHEDRCRGPGHRLDSIRAPQTSNRTDLRNIGASTFHWRRLLRSVYLLLSPSFGVNFPQIDALFSIVDNLRTRDKFLQIEWILREASIAAEVFLHEVWLGTCNDFDGAFVRGDARDHNLGVGHLTASHEEL